MAIPSYDDWLKSQPQYKAPSFKDITTKPEFQKATPEVKVDVATRFFNDNYASKNTNADSNALNDARSRFFKDYGIQVPQPKQPDKGVDIGTGLSNLYNSAKKGVEDFGEVITHPKETWDALSKQVGDAWNKEGETFNKEGLVNGTANAAGSLVLGGVNSFRNLGQGILSLPSDINNAYQGKEDTAPLIELPEVDNSFEKTHPFSAGVGDQAALMLIPGLGEAAEAGKTVQSLNTLQKIYKVGKSVVHGAGIGAGIGFAMENEQGLQGRINSLGQGAAIGGAFGGVGGAVGQLLPKKARVSEAPHLPPPTGSIINEHPILPPPNGGSTSSIPNNKPHLGPPDTNTAPLPKNSGTATGKWGKSPEFTNEVNKIAQQVGANPDDLMAVMSIESGLRANAKNPTSSATGLIQFMGKRGNYFGMSREQFANLPELQQLKYVGQWFANHKGRLNSPGKTYLAVAAPGILDTMPAHAGPDYVVYKAGSREARANPLWQDKNGNVTLGKLDNLVTSRKSKYGGSTTAPGQYKPNDYFERQMRKIEAEPIDPYIQSGKPADLFQAPPQAEQLAFKTGVPEDINARNLEGVTKLDFAGNKVKPTPIPENTHIYQNPNGHRLEVTPSEVNSRAVKTTMYDAEGNVIGTKTITPAKAAEIIQDHGFTSKQELKSQPIQLTNREKARLGNDVNKVINGIIKKKFGDPSEIGTLYQQAKNTNALDVVTQRLEKLSQRELNEIGKQIGC